MVDRSGTFIALSRTQVATAAAAMLIMMIPAGAAWPQAAAPPPSSLGVQEPIQQAAPDRPAPPQGEAAPSPSPPVREENPGLINEIGKMFGMLPALKSPSETIDDLNARAKDAGDTLSRLAKPLMVTGRLICPASTNGAPDCKTASDKLCQTKGFKEGKSLTADSAETCSSKVLIPGRTRKPDDCRTDTYVTRALCQ
jgi:hypothetical protein